MHRRWQHTGAQGLLVRALGHIGHLLRCTEWRRRCCTALCRSLLLALGRLRRRACLRRILLHIEAPRAGHGGGACKALLSCHHASLEERGAVPVASLLLRALKGAGGGAGRGGVG